MKMLALPESQWVCSCDGSIMSLPQTGILLYPADDRLAVGEDFIHAEIAPERGRNPSGVGAKRSLEAGLHRDSMHPRPVSVWGVCLIRCSPSAPLRGGAKCRLAVNSECDAQQHLASVS